MTVAVGADRAARVRAALAAHDVDVLLLSVGADLPWLTGYEAMPLERLTMLVMPRSGDATLVVPRLEAPRVMPRPELFDVRAWDETEDPLAIVAERCGASGPLRRAAVGDRTWARFVLGLQERCPGVAFVVAGEILGPLRAVKEPEEIEALQRAAAAADRVAAQLQGGGVPLVGRTEAAVSADLAARLLAEGHDRVNFAIVASGPNGASPHHDPGPRVIRPGDVVLCDFGGTMDGYCSDITRCVVAGGTEPEPLVHEAYSVLRAAQAAGVEAAAVGVTCEAVDAAARRVITDAGFGDAFVHRTGHGIGVEEHEDPYLVAGNAAPLVAGNAFSVEPGIYLTGRFGLRLEDIVVATEAGPRRLNRADHDLVIVDA